MSKAVIATIALWTAVGHWNSWFDAMIYTNKTSLLVLQLYLRQLLTSVSSDTDGLYFNTSNTGNIVNSASLTAAAVLLTIGPIVLLYPFLQKYFVKGIMVGSLKG